MPQVDHYFECQFMAALYARYMPDKDRMVNVEEMAYFAEFVWYVEISPRIIAINLVTPGCPLQQRIPQPVRYPDGAARHEERLFHPQYVFRDWICP